MKVIVWGAKGHAKVLAELFEQTGKRIVAIFDNDPSISAPIQDVPVFHGRGGFEAWIIDQNRSELSYAVAIGGDRGKDRVALAGFLAAHGIAPTKIVHPTAYLSPTSRAGEGCQFLASSTVGVDVTLGEHCIVNTAAVIDHECHLGKGVHLAPGATLAGCVVVGEYSFIGTNATILPHVQIGKSVTVGAGAVVTKDVPDGATVYGVPARVRVLNTLYSPPVTSQ